MSALEHGFPDSTLEVLYTCKACGLERTPARVAARRVGQSVREWMLEVCLPTLAVDHGLKSPTCKLYTFDEVLVPTNGLNPSVGAPVVH